MLEWLEVGSMSAMTRLMYGYRTEPLNSNRKALKQECCLTPIAGSST